MDVLLWILQAILAIKFISIAYSHGLRQDQVKMQQGIRRMGPVTRPVLFAVALGSLLAGIGLILPAAAAVSSWVTPLAAALLAGMMFVSIFLHRACRENPYVLPGLILLAMAALVAYGRSVIIPL